MACTVVGDVSIEQSSVNPTTGVMYIRVWILYIDPVAQVAGQDVIQVYRNPGDSQATLQANLKAEIVRHLKQVQPAFASYVSNDFTVLPVWSVL